MLSLFIALLTRHFILSKKMLLLVQLPVLASLNLLRYSKEFIMRLYLFFYTVAVNAPSSLSDFSHQYSSRTTKSSHKLLLQVS